MHLHGHNFFVLGEAPINETVKLNTENPQRRDTQLIRPGYQLVLQYNTDNPGIWPFHCHIAWHVSAGLYTSLMEHPDEIRKIQFPSLVHETCDAWSDYTKTTTVDQIDSGLRAMQVKE